MSFMKYTGMSYQQAVDVFKRGSIPEMMRSFSMFDKFDFERSVICVVDGARDAWEGVVGIGFGLYRLLLMMALYATYPISKPVMCALYRRKFRRNQHRTEVKTNAAD